MKELRPDATLSDEKTEPVPSGDAPTFFVASQDALFVETPVNRCDACGELLATGDESELDERLPYGIPGRGVYLWARGDETRLETVPLCSSCASAIGMTALARWEIEEEEG